MRSSEIRSIHIRKTGWLGVALLCFLVVVSYAQDKSENTDLQKGLIGDGTVRRIFVPVLMYHYISELPANADEIRTDLTVLPSDFDRHLNYLAENGYETITPGELIAGLLYGAPLPERSIILSFDDGHLDHYVNVLPALKRHGFTGTFFVITQFADEARQEYLNWEQIRSLAQAGMSIESHTKTHADLRSRSYDFLVYELLGSLESIEAHTSFPVSSLAYPMGRYDDHVLQILSDTPYRAAFTTQHGAYHISDRLFELPRLRVSHNTGVSGLAALIRSAK